MALGGGNGLLKPALNSPDPYPATTHPLAISVTAELLAERGAKVVIGDQSGIEHILHHPGGVIWGSTIENCARSGMGDRNDSRFMSFEDGGWDEGSSPDPRMTLLFPSTTGYGMPDTPASFVIS